MANNNSAIAAIAIKKINSYSSLVNFRNYSVKSFYYVNINKRKNAKILFHFNKVHHGIQNLMTLHPV